MINDIANKFKKRVRKFSELSILNLRPFQIFPPKDMMSLGIIIPDKNKLIAKNTPVGSMGSCFAREIKMHLETCGYNYILKGDSLHGSAPWERVYNTACIKQELMRAFNLFTPVYEVNDTGRVFDLYRKNAVFVSRDEANDEQESYVKCARAALLESEVFIFTLGLSEVWYDKISNYVLAQSPPSEIFSIEKYSCRLLSPEENYENLHQAFRLLKEKNPAIQIIITVSPVPLRSTFFNRSVIISNNVSKSSLIFAAHRIAAELSFVHYFPSYEIALFLSEEPFGWDCRHVTRETVSTIMQGFELQFC